MSQEEWERIFLNNAESLIERDSWSLEFSDRIDPANPRRGWKDYIRNTSARFRCSKCGRQWPSNQVKVIFHMKLTNGQGIVKVRRTRQDCKRCNDPPMERPDINKDNITILMKNLVKKIREKCYNEDHGRGEQPPQKLISKSPHEPDHCEGCKLGICSLGEKLSLDEQLSLLSLS